MCLTIGWPPMPPLYLPTLPSYLMRTLILSLGFISVASAASFGQARVYEERGHISVNSGTTARRAAWAGGYNVPQVAMADLNNDNRMDMVVFERYREVKTFINVATSGAPQYQYNPAYAKHFPHIEHYLYLLDYNCDGIEDLFHYGGNGLPATNPLATGGVGYEAHRGYYQNDTLKFQYYRQLFYFQFGGNINAYCSPSDVPGIADVDGDGDLDFMAYANSGTQVEYYQNLRVEDGLPCDSIRIKRRSTCWGRVAQGAGRTHYTGIGSGSFQCMDFLPRTPERERADAVPAAVAKTAAHAYNTICLVDINGDGDMDYLNGNSTFPDIQLLVNGRAQYGGSDSIVSQDTLWQGGGTQLNLPFFPKAQYVDADGDGKRDLLITPMSDGNSKNYDNLYLYKNIGTAAVPQFVFQQQDFLQNISLDAGSNSYPAFYDFNRDGKKDLFIGSTGLYQPGGTYRGQLLYLQNTSIAGIPSMSLQTSDAFGLSAHNLQGAAPAFGDVDGDGLDDLVLGHSDGKLSWIKNTAASATVQPIWTGTPIQLVTQTGVVIDVDNAAVPIFYDLNKDGRRDLLIGNQVGHLAYYRNNLGSGARLELIDAEVGNVKADFQTFQGFCAPFIGIIDNTGIEYLLSGTESGRIHRFDGFQNGAVGANFPMIDTAYSGLMLPGRSAPAVADIDGDGWYEMVVGNALGGVKLYKQVLTAQQGVEAVAQTSLAFDLFPNPAAHVLHLRRGNATAEAGVRIITPTGQTVAMATIAAGQQALTINIAGLTTGLYFVEVAERAAIATQRLAVVR